MCAQKDPQPPSCYRSEHVSAVLSIGDRVGHGSEKVVPTTKKNHLTFPMVWTYLTSHPHQSLVRDPSS
ncbi:hypothetical protein M404DRAFT_996289 [Pisolithus tinctorius Marx 270]|uniref:Uncharacterized protein n=1 Tax=Pisolithus tinctorius Marx 270 TaxID=870435 RepID=A0A0C3P7P8_PISTI|nr:hypothetical protein M404DRAFT_996289 [Pisolithus tinctorius Marx 270]